MKRHKTFAPYDIALMVTVVGILPWFGPFEFRAHEFVLFAVVPFVSVWTAAVIGGRRSGVSFADYIADLRTRDPSSLDERRKSH